MFKIKLLFLVVLSLALSPVANAATGDPIGWLDSVSSDCRINGWAFVKDNPPVTVNVQVYLDGPRGTGILVANVPTDVYRSDVNSYFGIDGNHGFAAAIPQIYHDGKTHTSYVYANNTVTVNISIVLSGVPKSCSPLPSPTPSTSPIPTPGTSVSLTPTPSSTVSLTPTPSLSITPTPTISVSPFPSPSILPSVTPTPTPINSDVIPPTVSITSPSSGVSFSYRIVLTASAQDNIGVAGVTFVREGDVALGLEDVYSPYSSYLYASRLSLGTHTITAIARDRAGNTTRSAPVTVNVIPPLDTIAPYISLASVIDVTPFTASIRWTTDEPADGQIEFCPVYSHCGNNTPIVAELSTAHIINLSGLSPNTKYYYWIKSRDGSGNLRVSPTRSFVTALPPDFFAPAISITSPLQGSAVSGRILITVNATDDVGVVGVKFYVDGVLIKAEDTYVPFNAYLYTDTLGNGSHVLYAIARDGAGNTTTSGSINISVNNLDLIAPYISAISVTGVTQFSATVRWTTSEPADGQLEFCLTSSRCGNYTPLVTQLTTAHEINLSGLTPGTLYYYRIKSKDFAGNTVTSFVKSFVTAN